MRQVTNRAALPGATFATRHAAGEDFGVGLAQTLEEFERWVLPASMGTPHPLYLGLVNSSPLPAAALGDLLVSSLNNNGGAFHQSPPMTTCEEEIVRSFARLFGLSGADGLLVPGGMFAMLQALVLARVHATGGPARPGFRLYASDVAHFTVVVVSAMVRGDWRCEDVIAIPSAGTRRHGASLGIGGAHPQGPRRGSHPFCCRRHGGNDGNRGHGPHRPHRRRQQGGRALVLHVDACYGGAAMLLESMRPVIPAASSWRIPLPSIRTNGSSFRSRRRWC